MELEFFSFKGWRELLIVRVQRSKVSKPFIWPQCKKAKCFKAPNINVIFNKSEFQGRRSRLWIWKQGFMKGKLHYISQYMPSACQWKTVYPILLSLPLVKRCVLKPLQFCKSAHLWCHKWYWYRSHVSDNSPSQLFVSPPDCLAAIFVHFQTDRRYNTVLAGS